MKGEEVREEEGVCKGTFYLNRVTGGKEQKLRGWKRRRARVSGGKKILRE